MIASRRRATGGFQPGRARIHACTGALPSAFAICGLPPLNRTVFFAGRDVAGAAAPLAFAALAGVADVAGRVRFAGFATSVDFALFADFVALRTTLLPRALVVAMPS